MFSYGDTHRHRLGSANFNQLPVNAPLRPPHTINRDGVMAFANPGEGAVKGKGGMGKMTSGEAV